MYCNYFGFSEKPFDVTPDPRYLYMSPSHEEILAALEYGIQERRGIIVTLGEVGTGKTTLLNAVLERFDESTQLAFIFNTDMTFEEMLKNALFDFGLTKPDETLSKFQAIQRLNDFAIRQLAINGTVVLIIDEAQNLDSRSLENLRLLSNLETHSHKLIQIILSGQPELDSKLKRHELRQLAQRINLKHYVMPLSENETYEYIHYRLDIANFKGSQLFDRSAQKCSWEYSQGIPRKINILCDNALLIGYSMGQKKINANVVNEAIKDLTWSPYEDPHKLSAAIPIEERSVQPKKKSRHRRIAMATGLTLLGCLIFFIGLYLKPSDLNLRRSASDLTNDGFHTNIISQTNTSADIADTARREAYVEPEMTWENELTIASHGKAKSVGTFIGGQLGRHQEAVSVPFETMKKETMSNLLTASEKHDTPLKGQPHPAAVKRVVVVEKGDTLGMIIKETYEKYDKKILSNVLQENPAIQSSDVILPGQIIRLPHLTDKP